MAPSRFDLYDQRLKGRLPKILRELRAAKVSYNEISDILRDKYDIAITGEGVRQWFKRLDEAA